MSKKVFIKTFGCQMNEYDSNRIYDSIKGIGYFKTEDQSNADCYILNTCHIRDKAKEKVYHEVGRIKKLYEKKNKPIMVVAGCVAQAENQEMLNRESYIDLIIGPQSYHKINSLLETFENKKIEETEFDSVSKFRYFDNIRNDNSKVSSFLTIQEGCDKFCHFCVVPYTRGPEYSRPFYQILDEAKYLAESGSKEIILLGQNVNSYHYEGKYKLSSLIKELNKIKELKRIRFTTSHPKDMTDDLISCYSECDKLMPILHLPIQSGSNKILKLMNRKHDTDHYLNIINKLKSANKDIKFSSDFIIGYPGETMEDFNDTIELVKKIGFINSYSYVFSPRPGTPSASEKLNNLKESQIRLKILQDILENFQQEENKKYLNKYSEVLIENKLKNQQKYHARTKYMTPVIFESEKCKPGDLINIKINSINKKYLFGNQKLNKEQAA